MTVNKEVYPKIRPPKSGTASQRVCCSGQHPDQSGCLAEGQLPPQCSGITCGQKKFLSVYWQQTEHAFVAESKDKATSQDCFFRRGKCLQFSLRHLFVTALPLFPLPP